MRISAASPGAEIARMRAAGLNSAVPRHAQRVTFQLVGATGGGCGGRSHVVHDWLQLFFNVKKKQLNRKDPPMSGPLLPSRS